MKSRYVALIRGINVGRAKRVAMADLRAQMERIGYSDVRTLLNSGNVVFSGAKEDPSRVSKRIEKAMVEKLGVSAAVTVVTAATFMNVVEENKLSAVARDPARFLVAFCGDPGGLKRVKPLMRQDWNPEALAVGSAAAYLWCHDGILSSKLLEAVGRALGDYATTRNWATVLKIHACLE